MLRARGEIIRDGLFERRHRSNSDALHFCVRQRREFRTASRRAILPLAGGLEVGVDVREAKDHARILEPRDCSAAAGVKYARKMAFHKVGRARREQWSIGWRRDMIVNGANGAP